MKFMKTRLILLVALAVVMGMALGAQSTKTDRIAAIRQYFQKVNAELATYTKREARWDAGEYYWNSTDYTGYFNAKNQLVLLKFGHGEEGSWAFFDYYFRDGEILFIFINSGEPDESEKQQRIYFWNQSVIEAFIKEKAPEDKRDINNLANQPHTEVLRDLSKSSQAQLEQVEYEVRNFREALSKTN